MTQPTTAPRRVAIAGALGRMGHAIGAAVEAHPDLTIGAVCDRPGTEGQALNGRHLMTPAAALEMADVLIDFSTAAAGAALAAHAAQRVRDGATTHPALIIGATGATAEEEAVIRRAADAVPIVRALNFSLGVNILAGIVEATARLLAARDWDIEIFEAHHKRKVDAPSGTAFLLGRAAAKGRHVDLDQVSERVRDGHPGARGEGAIGFSVMRGGGIIGEHTVSFIAEDEIITFAHSARDRSLFARGAVEAAHWVLGKPPGLYAMSDVLGFTRET